MAVLPYKYNSMSLASALSSPMISMIGLPLSCHRASVVLRFAFVFTGRLFGIGSMLSDVLVLPTGRPADLLRFGGGGICIDDGLSSAAVILFGYVNCGGASQCTP